MVSSTLRTAAQALGLRRLLRLDVAVGGQLLAEADAVTDRLQPFLQPLLLLDPFAPVPGGAGQVALRHQNGPPRVIEDDHELVAAFPDARRGTLPLGGQLRHRFRRQPGLRRPAGGPFRRPQLVHPVGVVELEGNPELLFQDDAEGLGP